MANRAYLTCCDIDRTYPSSVEEFNGKEHTVAASSYCLPMLWLGLFRLEDIRADEIEMEGDREVDGEMQFGLYIYREPAPFANKDKALAQLSSSLNRFDALFAESGSLAEHIDYLSEALSSANGKYVSIELVEIAYMEEPANFYNKVQYVLKYLGGEDVDDIKTILEELSTIHKGRPFYSPRGFFERNDLQTEDHQNLARLLGYEWERELPWG